MSDAEKIAALQAALRVAMIHWAAWLDDDHGIHPSEGMDAEAEDWRRCEKLLDKPIEPAR